MKPSNGIFRVLFGLSGEEIHENVIMTPFLSPEKFVSGPYEKRSFKGRLYSGINASHKKKGYTVLRVPMGSSFAGDCVLFLGMTKAKRVIYTGSCGALGPADIGDIYLCEKAFSGAGFSEYYLPGGGIDKILASGEVFTASPALVEDIMAASRGRGGTRDTMRRGSIFTIHSLAAETAEVVRKIEARGFDGIDMELASVYHAAVISGIEAAGILFAGDLPGKRPFWEKLGDPEKKKLDKAVRRTIEIAVASAVKCRGVLARQ
jgi:nucleoside phosphorylase